MKKLLGVLLAVVAVVTLGVTQLNAQGRDCDINSVIYCGAYTKSEFTQKYNQNKTGDLPALYAHYSINPAAINGAKEGVAMKNGDIVVAGKVVATGGRSVGRTNKPGSTSFIAGGTTFYERSNSVSFASNSISAFVFFDGNGQFTGAILKSCGNAVKATPVPVPPKPAAACVNVTTAAIDRTRVRFTTTYTAVHGAIVTSWYFDFGDGQNLNWKGPIADHVYEKPGTYTVKVTVKTNIGDFTSPACTAIIPIATAPTVICKDLVAAVSNRTDYSLTAHYTASGAATVTGYTFVIKNKTGTVVKQVTQAGPVLTGTLPDGSYTAQVTIKSNLGDRISDACKASFTISPQPIAECKNLTATISNRTQYSLTAIASVSGGVTIKGYTFTVKDSSGAVVSNMDSSAPTVTGELASAGTYTAQVTVKTSLGNRTGANCTTQIAIGVENCTVPGKETLPVNSPLCATTPPELPKTGAGDGIVGLIGVSSIVASTGYYIASRRGLLDAMLGR